MTGMLVNETAHSLATAQGWHLGIGDPTIGGWVLVLCYVAATLACIRAAGIAQVGARLAVRRDEPERRAQTRTSAYLASISFWAFLALMTVFFGLNKQIDLQTWFTDLGRRVAQAQGWYEQRRQVQLFFVVAVALAGIGSLGWLLYLTRNLLPRHVLGFVGLVILGCYVLTQASSFHTIDAVLAWRILDVVMVKWVMEFSGLVCIWTCAMRSVRWYAIDKAAAAADSGNRGAAPATG